MKEKIRIDLKRNYGLVFEEAEPINGGWLNRKWKIYTDKGTFLVKEFSPERFSGEKLKEINRALKRQGMIHNRGVCCPGVYHVDGDVVRILDHETSYMVMDFYPGNVKNSGTISLDQIYELGLECGKMHSRFGELTVDGVKGFPIDSDEFLNSLWDNYHYRVNQPRDLSSLEYERALRVQKDILKTITNGFLNRIPKGLAHEDFTSDNILFTEDGIGGIVDFDRNCYSFLWHDIGRALLSFALVNGKLDMDKVYSFMRGYSRYRLLSREDIADAFRISWCIESVWWIKPEFFQRDRGKATRFRDEIIWIGDNWFQLEKILNGRV